MTYYDALLLDVYTKAIRYAELQYSVMSARLKRSTKRIKGDNVVWPVMLQGEQGIGAGVLRGGAYPTQKEGGFLQGTAALKANRVAMQIYGIDARVLSTGTPSEQITSQLNEKVNSVQREWATDVNRQYWSDGTGALATVKTGVTSASVVVEDSKYIRIGMYLTVNEGSPFNDTVSNVDHFTDTVTFSGSHTFTAGVTMVRYGAANYEITGLQKAYNKNTTYHALDRATYTILNSYYENVGAALNFTQIDTMIAEIIYTYGGKPSILVGCKDTANWLQYLYKQKGAYPNTLTVQLGYRAIGYTTPWGEIPFIVEPHAPKHNLWAIDETNLWVRNPAEFEFVSGHDGYWHNDLSTDVAKAVGNWYSELVDETPWHSGRIYGYTTPIT